MNSVETKYHDLLRDSERYLPQDTRAGLTQARKTALSTSAPKLRRHRSWLPFSGVAVASLVAVVLVWPEIQPGVDAFLNGDPLISENLEMYQNLDFYHWLSQQGFSNNS